MEEKTSIYEHFPGMNAFGRWPEHVLPSLASVANQRRCPNSKMASVGLNPPPPELCENDPNFAVICSFLDQFGEACGIDYPAIDELSLMLQDTNDVSPLLLDLHIRLLRKAKKQVKVEQWEKGLIKFCHSYC
ncbi:unnamed protein product, partial [Darwinula stevensoni]